MTQSAGTITLEAITDMMRDILREPCTIRLYTNEVGPAPLASDFVEPEGGEYAPKPMRADQWDMVNAPYAAAYPAQLWHFTRHRDEDMNVLVRGYYVTRNSDGRLRWFQPLPGGPMKIVNDGDQVRVRPVFSLADPPAK